MLSINSVLDGFIRYILKHRDKSASYVKVCARGSKAANRSCQTNLVAIYDGVRILVDKGRATGVSYLGLCNVLYMAPYYIFISELETWFRRVEYSMVKELVG